MNGYRPLPRSVRVRESPIEGDGLFTTEHILAHTKLGVSHVLKDPNIIIRTPLGGHINHSDNPNAFLLKKDGYWELWTCQHIPEEIELTLKYGAIPLEGYVHI